MMTPTSEPYDKRAEQELAAAVDKAIEEIDLGNVLRSLNSMSNEAVRLLHERLAILGLVHEANLLRHQELEHFVLVKRVLGNAGVKL